MKFIEKYLNQAEKILQKIDKEQIVSTVELIYKTKIENGRIFFIGSGGGAGHASHAVNDFRKICNIECYSPSDNVSELTARINDDGWETSYSNWLLVSKINFKDLIFIISVGGGDEEKNISTNIVNSIKLGKKVGANICGIVGKKNGFTYQNADSVIVIPIEDQSLLTPHTESFQALVWHLLVSHPKLKENIAKWESISK